MKFDFLEFINSNHDFKLTNNNSFNFDSIKTNNYKIIDTFNFEKDTIGKIYDIMNDNNNDTYPLIEHKLFHKEKKNVFIFKKVNKNMGRRKRKRNQLFYIEPHHNKYKEDNIINKIKIHFTNRLMSYINKKYNEYKGPGPKKLLAKIKPNFTKVWTKKDNQEYLSKTVKEIFSEKLSNKCKRYPKNYNSKQIKSIIEKNEAKEVIDILNKTVKDMYIIYIRERKKIADFNIDNDLIIIEKRNGKEYTEEYRRIAMNLIEILNKRGRKVQTKYLN